MIRDLMHRLRAIARRTAVDGELDEELRHHFALQVDAYLAAGLPRDEAERRARLDIGGVVQIKEEHRDALGMRGLHDFWRDVRLAIRMLRRAPLFAATAMLTIALGLGANTLVFSVIQGLVFRPLPIAQPERVWFVQQAGSFTSHSFPVYRDLRDRNRTFVQLAGYRITMMQVETPQGPAHTWGYLATGSYFELLGIQAARGRFFGAADDRVAGASPFAVLSYDYWQTAFGGRDEVIGQTIRINRQPYTILGVAPQGFHGTEVFYRPAIWVPMMMQAQIEIGNPWLENRNTSNTWVIGRLADGVTTAQAEADLDRLMEQIARDAGTSASVKPATARLTRPGLVGDVLGGPARAFGLGLLALAGLVLLTACANLAGSLAARGADRQRELAIRVAIGAGRGRLLRQLLTETLVLVAIGGAIGTAAAILAARALSRWQLPIALPIQFDVDVDARVVIFTAIATILTALAIGCVPAFQAVRTAPHGSLRTRDGHDTRRFPLRDLLVAVQVALCVVLLGASLLAGHGLWHAMHMPLGLDPHGVTMATFDLGPAGYSRAASDALRRHIVDRLRAHPSVRDVAYGNSLPLNIDQSSAVFYADEARGGSPAEGTRTITYQVSPGFFSVLGIRVLEGRDVTWQDTADSSRIAVVNEAFARQIFRGELRRDRYLDRQVRMGLAGAPVTIVGVVETGRYQTLTEADKPVIFLPMLQVPNTTTVMLVRATQPDAAIAGIIQRVVRDEDPALPLFGVRSVTEMLGFARLPMQVAGIALGAFGLLAVALAATGVHGIVAYAVARRRRELAIRVAIGASRPSVVRLVLQRTFILVAAGTVAGLTLAAALQGVLASLLYQPGGTTLWVWAAVVGLVVMITIVACWWPTRRVLRIDPVAALAVD